MANGDKVIRPEPARIDVAELVDAIYPHIPRWQHQQLANAIRREWRDMAAEHTARRAAEQISQRIAAVAEISPGLAQKIELLPTAEDQEKYLDVVAGIVELVAALTTLYDAPPDPRTVTRIVINIEGPDVQTIIVPPRD